MDDSLLKQLQEGSPAAYERLVEEFEAPLYRFFVCGHRDHHLAEDQTAETFAQLVRSLPKMLGGPEKLPAFVFSIARHTKLRRWRRRKASNASLDAAMEICDPQPPPDEKVMSREQLELLLNAISCLEPAARDVVLLHLMEGYALNKVAAILDMPLGTVKSHVHRGRAHLTKFLQNSESEQ